MGCSSSTGAHSPADGFNDDKHFKAEAGFKRAKFSKITNEVVYAAEEPEDKPEGDFFEAEEAGEGEQFMAVKPWLGAIKEPDNHNPPNPAAPDVNYTLDYVYGYRCEDSRQNVYFNAAGQAVYMTAALGIVLDQASNTQVIFGGGQVDSKAKNVSDDSKCHTDDVTSITISSDRRYAVSGQVGTAPVVFVWDAQTGQMQKRFKLAKGARGVDAVAISADGSTVALVDRHDQHNVYVFDVASGAGKGSAVGDTNKIFDICFSAAQGDSTFVTVGAKHIKFWDANTIEAKRGIFGESGEQTSFSCAAFDDQGIAYTGGANGSIYLWTGNSLQSTVKAHDGGFVGALRWVDGKLYSGGKDGAVKIWTTAGGLTQEGSLDFGGVLIRAIDVFNGNALVGLRDGTIYQVDLGSQTKQMIMESHSDGEVWGLALVNEDVVVTSGDDNKLKTWSVSQRKCIARGEICQEDRHVKRRGASTLSTLADSKCARAVAYNPQSGHLAVGHNDGTLTIRAGVDKLDEIIAQNNDSKEWIENMEYSPDGSKLAVGSHDNNIYVYETQSYSHIGTCKGHNSFITSVDWSADGSYIRSVCGAYELLFFNGDSLKQDPNGASNTTGTQWATNNAKFGWLVEGVFPPGTDGSHINYVDFSHDGNLISTGDDYGLVNIFRNPCRKGHKPISLRGHSEHVVRVGFSNDDQYLFSVGGYDQTLMQFKRN